MDINDNDTSLERGFINKSDILSRVTEEQIFELVFGFEPEEFEYITSPFREDTRPGCWFERDLVSNKLWFKDFATNLVIDGIRIRVMDCFNAVQVYFKLPNFYKTLQFIKDRLIDGKNLDPIKDYKPKVTSIKLPVKRKKPKILIATRDLENKDKRFWSAYEITKEELIEDEVFATSKFKIINSRSGDYIQSTYDLCYAYLGFPDGRKKLYRPLKKGKHRFLGTVLGNDIGGYKSLPPFGRQLIITKAYKDYRVLKNQGLNVVWFQSEGTIPSIEMLLDLGSRFTRIIIFYDNDEAGINGAEKLRDTINELHNKMKSRFIYLPKKYLKRKIKDPSDMIKGEGRISLLQFLKDRNVL